jgi:hypothetical protein
MSSLNIEGERFIYLVKKTTTNPSFSKTFCLKSPSVIWNNSLDWSIVILSSSRGTSGFLFNKPFFVGDNKVFDLFGRKRDTKPNLKGSDLEKRANLKASDLEQSVTKRREKKRRPMDISYSLGSIQIVGVF